jgi:hypothetical protein
LRTPLTRFALSGPLHGLTIDRFACRDIAVRNPRQILDLLHAHFGENVFARSSVTT